MAKLWRKAFSALLSDNYNDRGENFEESFTVLEDELSIDESLKLGRRRLLLPSTKGRMVSLGVL